MSQPKIIAYLKPVCGWSQGVRAVLFKYGLEYDDRDIINVPENYEEMVRKSGQPLSPCVEIDGKMLGDVSGEEVEEYLLRQGIVKANAEENLVPIDRACSDELHEKMARGEVSFSQPITITGIGQKD